LFDSLPVWALFVVFVLGAVAVWQAGTQLSNSTDKLDDRFGWGDAFGGLILLAVATNLPEIAITVTASIAGNFDIATGNLLGGVAIQTAVLALLDAFGLHDKPPLSGRINTLIPVLEAVFVIAILILAIMGTQLSGSLIFVRVAPSSLIIFATWLLGLWLLNKARRGLPWQVKAEQNGDSQPNGKDDKQNDKDTNKQSNKDSDKQNGKDADNSKDKGQSQDKQSGIGKTLAIFVVAAVVTLIGGFVLEESGNALAQQFNLNQVFFGATFLAAATALPELSTGLASLKLKDYQLAVSDIFGGNAFLLVLFLVADLVSGKAVLSQAKNSDIYLSGLGILLTTVYIYGLVFRPRRQFLGMGLDSVAVVVLYVLGIVGLLAIPNK